MHVVREAYFLLVASSLLAVMTGRNCHSGITGLVLNDNGSRRMLAGLSPLNGTLTSLESFQVISSHRYLNYALCNKI